MGVQRQWMYLENVFVGMGSENIRQQLPMESKMFDSVNSNFKFVMDLPCNIRRDGGQSLVIGGPSLVMLEGKACNPL